MQRIHPKERYSKSEVRDQFDPDRITGVARALGFDPKESPKRLSGGYKNANYLLVTTDERLVLRESATDFQTTTKEGNLLNAMKDLGVKCPSCKLVRQLPEGLFAIHEFIDGQTLEDHLLADGPVSEPLFFQIGVQSATIHKSLSFETDGFLGEDLDVITDMGNTDEFLPGYMSEVLSTASEDRLPKSTGDRLLRLIKEEWHQVRDTNRNNQLTHMDFNPKNLLVSDKGDFLAVIDWEFTDR